MSGGAKEGRIVGRKALSHYLGSCLCRRRRRATRIKLPIPLGPLRPSFPALAADGFGDVRAGASVGGSSYFRCLMDVNIGVPRPNFTVILGAVRLCCCLVGRSFNTLRYSHALLIHNRSLNSCCSMFCGMEPFSYLAPDTTGWRFCSSSD